MKRSWKLDLLVFLLCIALIGAVISVKYPQYAPYAFLNSFATSGRAVIVDQIAITDDTSVFVKDAKRILQTRGYNVDVVSGRAVTLEFLHSLPKMGYRLIIMNTHASSVYGVQGSTFSGPPSLFTGERYDQNSNSSWLKRGEATTGVMYALPAVPYVAIGPKFVSVMDGAFPLSIIIISGCEGLARPNLAYALVGKGAIGVVGFNGPVSLGYSNMITLRFLELYVSGKFGLADAVAGADGELGSDPVFKSRLTNYP